MNPSQTQGMSGTINKDPFVVMPGRYVSTYIQSFYLPRVRLHMSNCEQHSVVPSPLLSVDLPNIRETHAISVQYLNPHYKEGTVFQHKLLKGITMPSRATTREDVESGYGQDAQHVDVDRSSNKNRCCTERTEAASVDLGTCSNSSSRIINSRTGITARPTG